MMASTNDKKEKLNILLINPPQSEAYGRLRAPRQMHMGLAYLASLVQENNVKILDMDAEKIDCQKFPDIISNEKFDIVGITVTTPVFLSSLKLAQLVKSYSPGTLVVFGGVHPTIRPQEVLNSDSVDLVVKGEGEITFKEIVDCLKQDRGFLTVAGIAYKENGIIKETPPRPLITDLDTLPFPARHLFKNRQYTYPDSLYKATAPIITSRGCPGVCTFCTSHNIFGRKFRTRGAKNVADEIELLVKQWKIKEIHIWDDNFTAIKQRVFEIKDEILKKNLKVKFAFPNGIRADSLDREILEALSKMGTYSLAIGVESGSQEVLDRCRKGIRLEEVEKIFGLAKEMHFETWAFFMIGLPRDNPDTIKQTIDFAKKIDPDVAKFHILKPYPGSEVYDYLRAKNYILSEDYNQFGIHTPAVHRLEGLGPSDIAQWQRRAYVSFYFRPKKILKEILRLKTFNRFILNLQAAQGLLKMHFFRK